VFGPLANCIQVVTRVGFEFHRHSDGKATASWALLFGSNTADWSCDVNASRDKYIRPAMGRHRLSYEE